MDYSMRSDVELLLIFRSGDIQGFNTLFNRHWKSLYCLARRILEDDDLAKDALQEAFVALYQSPPEKEIRNVAPWLFQCVKYQCFMHLRSSKISRRHIDRLHTVSSANDVEEYITVQELEKLLLQEIGALPEKCREVFYLSRFESLSNKKIAEQLNISQKTVEHQITKALKTLRLSIEKLAVLALLATF